MESSKSSLKAIGNSLNPDRVWELVHFVSRTSEGRRKISCSGRKRAVAGPGRTLKRHALGQALKVILDTFAPGKWTIIAWLIISKHFFENYEGKSKVLFTKLPTGPLRVCDTL